MRKIKSYFRGVAEEAHRVRWPKKKDFLSSVAVVMSVTILSALVILLLDFVTLYVIKGFENIGGGSSDSTSSAAALIVNFFKRGF